MSVVPDMLYHLGGVPVGSFELGMPKKAFFVDTHTGNDSNDGEKWESAKATIQGGIDVANTVAHTYTDIDVYVHSGYYSETVVISNIPQGLSYGFFVGLHATTAHYGSEVGKLRLIGSGLVHLTSGTSATAPALTVGRPNTEVWNFECLQDTTVTEGGWTCPINTSMTILYIGMPAMMIVKENNYTTSGVNGGHGTWCKFFNCDFKGAPSSPATIKGAVGAYLRGASNSRFYNCDFQNSSVGLIVAGSHIQIGHDNQFFNCRFQGNTVDFMPGGEQHTQLIDCSWMDDGSTKISKDARWGSDSIDCAIIGGAMNTSTLPTTGPTGWVALGVKATDSNGILGDGDLST